MNRASLSETLTSHRWQTIGQPVTFQQAAKDKRGKEGVGQKGEDACLARCGVWINKEGKKETKKG